MDKSSEYIEVEKTLPLEIDGVLRQKWLKFTNLRYFGAEDIPLDTPSSKISQEHKDVHWHVCAGRRIKVKLRLYNDGSLEVLPQKFFSKSKIPLDS